jgi:general secretion pathway protein G
MLAAASIARGLWHGRICLADHMEVGKQAPALGMRGHRQHGLTLVEMVVALIVAATLAAIAIPSYRGYLERVSINTAIADISRIRLGIDQFRLREGRLPDDLAEAGFGGMRDPWGNAYEYLNFSSDQPGIPGKRRKDRNLVPINSEFDLYSRGPDGLSRAPLTARHSRDDIVMARDGSFIGVAADY